MHDELTGLANRRQLIRMLQRALDDLHHPNIHNALLYMDLNNFKPVNDRYGHDVGDQLLVAFSERLQQCIRQQDLAVRLGGDEFVILIRELAGTRQDAQKVLKETEKRCYQSLSKPYRIGGHLIECPPSIGTVLITPEMDDVDDLIKAGDLAMYRAKHRHKSSSGGSFPDAEGFT